MTGRLDRDVVLASLNPRDVLAHFLIEGKARGGSEFATGICPSCGPRKRKDGVFVNLSSGRWHCKAHGCAGSILDLIAGFSGLTLPGDLDAAIRIAATIAGVGPETDPARAAECAARRREQEETQRHVAEAKRREAIERARKGWCTLPTRSLRGESYLLVQRGIDPTLLSRAHLRFTAAGDPAVALWSSKGELVNIVTRRVEPGEGPRVLGLKDCPGKGTLVGSLHRGVPALTVVTEGVMDSLVASLAWPEALVLGAHGASNFAMVAAAAAKLVKRAGTELLLVGHRDTAGEQAVDAALASADLAGLAWPNGPGPGVRVLALDHNDLADAWKAGWRP